MSLPRYSKYKDSGVDWVGAVPDHWEVKPLFGLATERDESNFGMLEDNLLSLSYGRIVQKDMESNDGLLPESFETYQIVHPGDIVFRLTDLQNDKRSLRTAVVGQRGIITSAYLAVMPDKIQSQFFHYLLRAYDLTKVFYSMGGGLRQSMNFSDVKRLPILAPPPFEQFRIAAFLDRETGKIDALVEEQRRLIELLKEKRQAVISHAVTKGLNPDAPMKDSGIEWLGEVPEHWHVKRIKYAICKLEQGWSPQCENYAAEEGEWAVLKVGCVNGGAFNPDENKALPPELSAIPELGIHAGDVLISRANTRELVGSAGVPQFDYPHHLLCDKLYRLRLREDICLPEYLAMFLCTPPARGEIELSATGASSSMVNIGQSTITEMPMPLPSIEEQQRITSFVTHETVKSDRLIAAATHAIDLLQERRSALISAAVTGKIDVRRLVTVNAA